MSVLSDARILEKIHDKELRIDPFVFDNVQPSSIDLTLDNRIRTPKSGITLNAFNDIRPDLQNQFIKASIHFIGDQSSVFLRLSGLLVRLWLSLLFSVPKIL